MSSRIEATFQAARNTVKANVEDGTVKWRPRGRIENFLTEIVALAILDDWMPMEAALREAEVVDDPAPIRRIRPYTQRAIWESGRKKRRAVDLVLVLEYGFGREDEVWLEVKAGSGFSGDQMDLYLDTIHRARDGSNALPAEAAVRRRLAVLGSPWLAVSYAHRDGTPVRLVRWDRVAAFGAAPTASRLWHEVSRFIVEQRLIAETAADGSEVTATRAAIDWLSDALSQALGPESVQSDWLAWTYGRNPALRRESMSRFMAQRQAEGKPLEVLRQGQRGGLVAVRIGLAARPTLLRVQLCLTASYFVPHRVLRTRAVASDLSERGWWVGDPDESEILTLHADADLVPGSGSAAAAGTWIRDQLAVLYERGLLVDLDGNGNDAGEQA